mgnify:FL=1
MPYYKQDKKNKDGLTQYIVKVNIGDKQIKRTTYGLSRAKDLENRLLREYTDKKINTSSMTLDQLFRDYNKNTRADIRQSTLSRRLTVYNQHIAPYLGDKRLKDLDIQTLTEWKNIENSKDLSLVTRRNSFQVLKAVLNYGVKMEYINFNPLNKIDNFKDSYSEEKEIQFYTPGEFKRYIAQALEYATKKDFYDFYVFFMIAYFTGLRKGEIHALRWNCINSDSLSVKKSITQKLKGGDVETPPKNKSSVRTIKMPKQLIDCLSEHKVRQQKVIKDWNDTGFVCGYYKSLRDTSIDKENRRYARQRNLKRIRIHDFRHSHASFLINNNISRLEVAHRLGHSTVEQTLKTYSHLFPNEEDRATKLLEEIEF